MNILYIICFFLHKIKVNFLVFNKSIYKLLICLNLEFSSQYICQFSCLKVLHTIDMYIFFFYSYEDFN